MAASASWLAIKRKHLKKPSSSPDFDRVAWVYRWAEYLLLGNLLRLTRESLLPEVLHCRQALLLGDGDGRFAAKLLRSSPDLRVHAVDTSARMLHLLARRCARDGNAARLSLQQHSALEATTPARCDLVVTHFFLDCLQQEEVVALALRLLHTSSADTLWIISDFGLPVRPLLRQWAQVYLRLLYLAFRLLTGLRVQQLPQIAIALEFAGWTCVARRERLCGFLYSEIWRRRAAPTRASDGGRPAIDATSTTGRTSTHR